MKNSCLGFLPGDLVEKVNPYLRPLYDALYDILGFDKVGKLIERNIIEIAPLAYMRGRTLNNAFIILDEAQGLTQFQLKSIITRVGANSKIVVLGNLAQIDNKYITPLTSGLTYLVERFKHFEHSGIMHVNGIERSRLAAFAEENL